MDTRERGPQFVRSIGDELLPGVPDVPLRLQTGFKLGLSLLAAHELAVDEDDGPGYEERHQEPGHRGHGSQKLVGGLDLSAEFIAQPDQYCAHAAESVVELRVGQFLRRSANRCLGEER